MVKTSIYNLRGEKEKDLDLNPEIFEVKENPSVLAQQVVVQMANKRKAISHTKTRDEVSGGGRKPFRQKGTGRARAGSSRSPLWVGGGVTFGPRKTRNYSKRVLKKIRSRSLRMLLSDKIKNKKFIILKDFDLPKISTSQIQAVFEKLPIEEGNILVVLDKMNVNVELSLANIPFAKSIRVENLSTLNLMKYDYIVITHDAVDKLGKILENKDVK
ncbi:50S ribosomal protein L4 [Candidatus Berkelbacteria bacterium RBG_13_40_8]|uniref:Large ribosomal subunit protein uL4 n=1 Tax=Candidatus Berkelbacteria bacterium RBG_13_40_8 TaxID=1797467 RepID=A0A1F5DM05_9BACT|nr:MAG: 50S ribosomal protein L4 [Candidatus Berkelbacteria bacterium RBG_13_40_8]